jgi:hypothetical protein
MSFSGGQRDPAQVTLGFSRKAPCQNDLVGAEENIGGVVAILRPVAAVIVSVSPSGCVELRLPSRRRSWWCDGLGSAMWIALRQHDGRIGEASEMLAGIWRLDPVDVRCVMNSWAAELCDAGFLRLEK